MSLRVWSLSKAFGGCQRVGWKPAIPRRCKKKYIWRNSQWWWAFFILNVLLSLTVFGQKVLSLPTFQFRLFSFENPLFKVFQISNSIILWILRDFCTSAHQSFRSQTPFSRLFHFGLFLFFPIFDHTTANCMTWTFLLPYLQFSNLFVASQIEKHQR